MIKLLSGSIIIEQILEFKYIVLLYNYFLNSILQNNNNHHHLFHAVEQIDAKVMWTNANLLFWLSLLPFVSGFMGENHFAPLPVLLYAIVKIMSAVAYTILTTFLTKIHHKDSIINKTQKESKEGKISLMLYFSAVCIAYFFPKITCCIFVIVAIMWFIPNKKIEEEIKKQI